MYPDGKTFHSVPSTASFLAGMSADLRFVIDAPRIEDPVRRVRVRDGQRCRIVGFGEFNECARQGTLLTDPEAAVGRVVMGHRGAQLLEVARALPGGNGRSLDR